LIAFFKGDDNCVVCLVSNGNYLVQHMYTPLSPLRPALLDTNKPDTGISKATISYSNGTFMCSFNRQKSSPSVANFFDLGGNNTYYLLVAKGDVIGGFLKYHDTRLSSNNPIDFQTTSSSTGESGQDKGLARAHGIKIFFEFLFFLYMKKVYP
jgi:hypothetical protein